MTTSTRGRPRQPTDIGVDGPTPRDMLRHLPAVRADPLGFLATTYREYGDLVAFPVPGPPVLLVSDPADVRQVLQTGARHWNKQTIQYAALARVTGPGLLASSDPSWIDHRRVAAPAFHHRRLDLATHHVRAATREVTARWDTLPRAGGTVDVADTSLRLALDVVGRTLLSTDLSERADDLLRATQAAAKLVVALGRSLVPVPARYPTPLNLRLRAANRRLDGLSHDLIDDRRRHRGRAPGAGSGSPADPSGTHGDDLLGLLIDGGLSDEEIRDELVTMVVAGHETTAASLTWTLMLLAENPQVQDALRTEVRAHRGPLSLADAARHLPFTRAVLDESLRLYPPAWVLTRRSTAPDTLGGRAVPVGTTVIISPWLLHRREESWPDATTFVPGRFLDGVDSRPRPDYVPFGLGPRLCIGRELALGEMTLALAELLRHHAVSVPPGWVRPAPQAFVAVHPRRGMRLVVTPCPVDAPVTEAATARASVP